ncbi:MAG: Dabb family protein [Glaciihabitans sp.]
MIRHVVSWKLNAVDDAGKSVAFQEIADALNPLADSIAEVQTLRVARNSAFPETNWDVILIADYNSVEDLEAYQVHPDHVAAAAIVRSHVAERASIDFEL